MIINLSDKFRFTKDAAKVGITTGCYDLIHYYHVAFLEKCRRQCDILIVGVDSDRLIRKNKGGGRPIINEYDRLRMVDSIKYVDYAFIMDKHEELDQTYKLFNCDFLFRNGDFTNNNITLNEVVIPDVKSLTSTTDIINNIRGVKCK